MNIVFLVLISRMMEIGECLLARSRKMEIPAEGDTSELLNLVRRSDKPTFVFLSSQPEYRRGTYKLVAFYI